MTVCSQKYKTIWPLQLKEHIKFMSADNEDLRFNEHLFQLSSYL